MFVCSFLCFHVYVRLWADKHFGGAWSGRVHIPCGPFPSGVRRATSIVSTETVPVRKMRCVVGAERKVGTQRCGERRKHRRICTFTREPLEEIARKHETSKFFLIELQFFSTASSSRTQSRIKPHIRLVMDGSSEFLACWLARSKCGRVRTSISVLIGPTRIPLQPGAEVFSVEDVLYSFRSILVILA